jgi:drug/metabolite transporter (DMT)-like permease
MATLIALLAAGVYGAGDFLGGIASKRTAAAAVVVISQIAGLALYVAVLPFVPSVFRASDLPWGILAGIGGAVGIGALYAALAIGRMGIVSPITAVVGASVPVAVGLALGERPSLLELAGVALAFVAVALVSANADTLRPSIHEPGLGLALISGLGIGISLTALSRGGHGVGLALLGPTRVVSVLLLLAWAFARRESLRPATGSLPTILGAGALDMGANVLYVLATQRGMLAIVAVITSLYPASTVFLARIFLREKLTSLQWIGVACAAGGVVMIAL